jgi:L-fuconolactonase
MENSKQEIIDAYSHCGLSKYEPIEKVRAAMSAAGVSRAVLVQHLGEFDNTYIGSIVESEPQHFAGVLLVDPHQADVISTLQRWAATGNFQGIRLTTEALAAAPTLFAAAGDLGLAIVLYAPDGMRPSLSTLEKELRLAPFTRLVVTHLGTPKVEGSTLDESARDVFQLAKFSNVYLQVSGMKMFCPYPHEPLYPLIAEACEHFGPNRLMWGSNFPVCGTQEDYRADLNLLLEGRWPIPREAIPQVAGDNARRFWFGRTT